MVKAEAARRLGEAGDLLAADVGQRIRQARQARGMSLAQLGGEDLSRSFLSLVELGHSRISLRALKIVADRLELPISYFLSDSTESAVLAAELALNEAEAKLDQHADEECLRLLEGAGELRSPGEHARRDWLKGRALLNLRRPKEALDALREALAAAEEEGDDHFVAQVRCMLGGALYASGSYDEALVHLRQALNDVMTGGEDPVLTGKITVLVGHILSMRGDLDGAITHYRRARELFGAVRDYYTQGCIYSGLSLAFKRKGDLPSAVRYSRLSVGMFRACNNLHQIASEVTNMALAYEEMGDLEEARQLAEDGLERAKSVHADELEAMAHSALASIYFRQGQIDQAAREAEAAEGLAPDQDGISRARSWRVLAEVAEQNGDHMWADELYERSLQVFRDEEREASFRETALAYSRLLEKRGNLKGALEQAHRAIESGHAR